MTNSVIIPSNPADKKIILDAIMEIDASMIRIAAEKDQIKSIIEATLEKYDGIDKKYIKKMAQVYHKQNFSQVQGDNEDFVELYSSIVV